MPDPFVYEIPSAASGDSGLEGYVVEAQGRRAGRVAALNATPDGLVFVVDTGDDYRPLPAGAVERIESGGRVLLLSPDGEEELARTAPVEPRIARTDTPQLVRFAPRELDRLTIVGERRPERRSALWYVGAPLLLVGLVGTMAGVYAFAVGAGGSLRWLWLVLPLGIVVAAVLVLSAAVDRDSPRKLRPHEKLADGLAVAFGVTPRTRRRG